MNRINPVLRRNHLNISRITQMATSTTISSSQQQIQSPPPPSIDSIQSNTNNKNSTEKYIEDRVNNLFNIILADISSWQQYNHQQNKPNSIIYQDPYDSKDQILQDLVRNNQQINRNYNIQDLIEDEFQLEISDKEFEQFKTLNDIAQYVNRRWEIRQQLLAAHSADYAYPSYWY
ncbi:hypothetical protein DERP_000561 [Dermatophagoides pteronyssinus]|uniref:Uncharacterized protein n=1 Tax=Dermatophagoides pteronyssinus TaxID=6956 RepID=A0ABQ8J0P8_DERPT|nr:hypothetical protein DERP_000561 [Dermatophagoides pteronyssinus]